MSSSSPCAVRPPTKPTPTAKRQILTTSGSRATPNWPFLLDCPSGLTASSETGKSAVTHLPRAVEQELCMSGCRYVLRLRTRFSTQLERLQNVGLCDDASHPAVFGNDQQQRLPVLAHQQAHRLYQV